MVLANVIFGERGKRRIDKIEDRVVWYLTTLERGGQIEEDYSCAWIKGTLHAYVNLRGRDAFAPQYHTGYAKNVLNELVELFGQLPVWTILDDVAPRNAPRWKKASSLYLYSREWITAPPICHGDTGIPIPTYLFPLDDDTKEKIHFWYQSYSRLISLWFSGHLEIPAYRQLAEPDSLFAQEGRGLCKTIESATGIPTYYYLMRYWGRRKEEEDRRCPLCDEKWFLQPNEVHNWQGRDDIHFRCNTCRLVSSRANTDDDERHARIGEYRRHRESSLKFPAMGDTGKTGTKSHE